MDDGEITVAPTCTTDGVMTFTCKRGCGHTQTKEIPMAHDIVVVPAKAATCYENGYTASVHCTLCDYSVESIVIPGGHKGEWVAIDSSYEKLVCTECGRMEKREKNAVVDFEGATIPYGKYAFSVIVGDLKGEGAPSVDAAAGLTEFGNARDKFTLAGDTYNKVLQIVSKNNTNYNTSTVKLYLTDALHNKGTGEDGGQYLVLDFDIKFDSFKGDGTSRTIFTLNGYEALGANWLSNFAFYNYNGKLRVGSSDAGYVKNADGEYADTWFTFRAVTTLVDGDSGNTVTNLYYKEKGSDSPMTLLMSSSRSGSYGTVNRTNSHYYQFEIGANDHDYAYDLDNISFIRTADASYTYCACDHVISETVTSATCDGEASVKRVCTAEGCGYVKTEYIPAAGHNFSDWTVVVDHEERACAGCGLTESRPILIITPTVYGDEYLHAAGDMGTDTKLVAGKADIITDKHLIFTAQVGSFNGLRIGHGYANYTACYIEIDNTSVKYYFYSGGHNLMQEKEHGLDIGGIIKITIDVNHRRVATIKIEANGEAFEFSTGTNWYGSNGEIYAESLDSTLYGAQLAFTCDGYDKDIHFYGDSYLSQSSDRWLYYAFAEGHTNALFDGYGGRTSDGAIASLLENLKHSTPETVVWMLGMNDGSDSNINAPSNAWATNRDKLIALSEEYGFEIIFTTIPTVPNINHEAKNKWIRESGYRYIDMAAGLGADGTGAWTEGYLHTDNVHPTNAGAEAIYNQVAKDFPEFVAE